jgi:hypothetical protein
MQTTLPAQAIDQSELPMDYTPALEQEMRVFYETRWSRWHRAHNFDLAMQDPVTSRCLLLAVQHLPHNRRNRAK